MSITVEQWAKRLSTNISTFQQAFQATMQDAFHTKRQIHKASKMQKHTRTHTTNAQKVKMCTSTHPNKQSEHA
jgi:hypothetical protein